jgi:copper chaperone CopZ
MIDRALSSAIVHGLWSGAKRTMIKKTFNIPDMTCSNCAMKLESLEDSLEGVKEINASYHKLQMVIEYDESKLSDEQIIAAVKKKGYQAIPA